MKFLKCKICGGEVDIIGNDRSVHRKTKCHKCGHGNAEVAKAAPEVFMIRKRPPLE